MTAIAPFTPPLHLNHPHKSTSHLSYMSVYSSSPAPPPPPTGRSINDDKAPSSRARVGQKRLLTPRTSFSLAGERISTHEGDDRAFDTATDLSATPSHPPSWLHRLSGDTSTTPDSSRVLPSCPVSAALSRSNASMAFSQTPPVAGVPLSDPPATLPRNRLVKRTSSLCSVNGSPHFTPGSRIPLPVLKRPATTHQRSKTFHDTLLGSDRREGFPPRELSSPFRDSSLDSYFTPRALRSGHGARKRRTISGIPYPIKRVYPDRRYAPVLVSGMESIHPAKLEADEITDGDDSGSDASARPRTVTGVVSSHSMVGAVPFEAAPATRRSFSIGDLFSAGSQPLWRRSKQGKPRTTGSRLLRKGNQRISSAPPSVVMGGNFSRSLDADSEPPAKRREVADASEFAAEHSAFIPLRDHGINPFTSHEIQLQLDSESLRSQTVIRRDGRSGDSLGAHAPSPLDQRSLPPADARSAAVRLARVSAAQSEITSSIGSDSECRSTGDVSSDYQSDAVYDSYPTRTTRSSSGRRGPHIETIFDDSPPTFSSSGRSTRLADLLNDGSYSGNELPVRYRHSIIEEEESVVSTPRRSLHESVKTATPPTRSGVPRFFGSSPPLMPSIPFMPDPDDMNWDGPDEGVTDSAVATDHPPVVEFDVAQTEQPLRLGGLLSELNAHSTPVHASSYRTNGERPNPFEWSETQPSPYHNLSPQRPRTVHGKKDPENRGSRAAGRRAPSGMHARSHSVPVVPDTDGKRNNAVANKFGTWGVGSKGVTEDWNEDFDFDEFAAPGVDRLQRDERRIDSGHEMFVPRSIREQQQNVMANIGLLREWGLLIEELKELRIRAHALDMMNGLYAGAWEQVDAMIELADQETEEQTVEPRKSPPSSPGFDYQAFEDERPNIDSVGSQDVDMGGVGPAHDAHSAASGTASPHPSTPLHQVIQNRPRKDSEAVARSIIEALQSKRSVSESDKFASGVPSKKVPFDTAALRHIVPYVNGLKRKVKDALRETEGLYSSPRRPVASTHPRPEPADVPAFQSIFDEPLSEADAAKRRSRRNRAATDHDEAEESARDLHRDLTHRMRKMSLTRV